MKKVLVFDSKSFLKHSQEQSKGRFTLPSATVVEINKWSGKRVHKYAKNSVKRRVFGETHYILVGSEKVSVAKEFCVWKETEVR